MMADKIALPTLQQFRIDRRPDGLIHLIFDMPGRTMNVFSNAAIHELSAFALWLQQSDVRGVVVRSGKTTAFCAGADLNELAAAYDMIMAEPPVSRFDAAFKHFFVLSAAIRALEMSGKPIAAVVSGLALGGGCEFAMGAHYRVLTDSAGAALGLPESLVGLMPGAGGTQRLPRLIGLRAALPILLEGARLSGRAAVEAGLAHVLVKPGEEIDAAEQWLLTGARSEQPWDRRDWSSPRIEDVHVVIKEARAGVLARTMGHYPAMLAILDCLEFGLPQSFDTAIRNEMGIFSELIQRPEPRNMIQTVFLGKADYERRRKRGEMPSVVDEVLRTVQGVLSGRHAESTALASVGFTRVEEAAVGPVRQRAAPGYWVLDDAADPLRQAALTVLREIAEAVKPFVERLTESERRLADYAVISELGYPAYLGGPFTFDG
jgi:3-hydroxyacyl-CoA dehydrogenase/enoyl-CoA hydratase/3-hydroxybutyryl-CoA epimerase